MGLRILILKGHQTCMIGFTKMYDFNYVFSPGLIRVFFLDLERVYCIVDNRGVSKGRFVAVGISEKWKVICHMSHMTREM